MKVWKSILSALIALWLPLHGYVAIAMPFCEHNMAAASTLRGAADHSRHHHGGHSDFETQTDVSIDAADIAHGSHIGSNDASGLGCNNCGTCHLACSPVISAITPAYLPIGGSVLEPTPTDAPHFYYPEQLQRPPLSALL